ncbi:hypothetical protein F5Y19DRAFT_467352 [Xylariaceae sp. FL1651]|nr:hypothetical protein F5Y19DRAFT_467352 [Xylariaceae sp. FL1651]
MDFIRASMLRRGRTQEGQTPDLEQQRPTDVEERPRDGSRLFTMNRPALSSLFTGRSNLDARGQRPTEDESEADDGPKSPSSNGFRMPILTRARTRDMANQLSSEAGTPGREAPSRMSIIRTRTQRFPVVAQPAAVRTNGEGTERQAGRSRFQGSDPAELHLANLAETGRRRQRQHDRQGNSDGSRRRRHKETPKHFLFCFPWVKSRRVRSNILRCFVSGIFLISMLTIYLSLSITKNINTSEFSILLILLILLTTIFFCHGLVRLCMLLVRSRDRQGASNANGAEANGNGSTGGYAIPRRPIRVVLARDEEAAGIESETTKVKPPAYGLWRESVRVDPDRIYWQRAASPPPSPPTSVSSIDSSIGEAERPRTAQRRPPSYASDDGIDYVVDARPRSIAPPPSSVRAATPAPALTPTAGRNRIGPANGSRATWKLVNGVKQAA